MAVGIVKYMMATAAVATALAAPAQAQPSAQGTGPSPQTSTLTVAQAGKIVKASEEFSMRYMALGLVYNNHSKGYQANSVTAADCKKIEPLQQEAAAPAVYKQAVQALVDAKAITPETAAKRIPVYESFMRMAAGQDANVSKSCADLGIPNVGISHLPAAPRQP